MKNNNYRDHPIGVFDSGVGGLTVLREILLRLPSEDTIYLADQAHVPYGHRTNVEIRRFSQEISRYLISQGSKLIVVACNSISAAALEHLRLAFPDIPFVGMEPAVKPAAITSKSGVIGVLATPATLRSDLFNRTSARFASNLEVVPVTFNGLVEQIELGNINTEHTRSLIASGLEPCLSKGADTLVLACTHYPLILKELQDLVGPAITIIDPSAPVARQTQRVLAELDLLSTSPEAKQPRIMSSKDAVQLVQQAENLLGITGSAIDLRWDADSLKPRI